MPTGQKRKWRWSSKSIPSPKLPLNSVLGEIDGAAETVPREQQGLGFGSIDSTQSTQNSDVRLAKFRRRGSKLLSFVGLPKNTGMIKRKLFD